jgi:hypothetical protein
MKPFSDRIKIKIYDESKKPIHSLSGTKQSVKKAFDEFIKRKM